LPADSDPRSIYGANYINFAENDAGMPANPGNNGVTDEANTNWNDGRLIAASYASKYFDFGVTDSTATDPNHVVFVYYDEDAGRLKLKYSAAAIDGSAPLAPQTWENNSSLEFPLYVGMYVSMALDGDAVHIAALDANDGDLMYFYVPDYTQGTYKAVTVDQYGSVGNWTQIKLGTLPGSSTPAQVPFISYFNLTDVGSRDPLKLAWPKAAITSVAGVKPGVTADGYTTGDWEYMTVPALTPPQGGSPKFQKVNLGFRNDNRPVLGYLGNTIEFSYPVDE
jgi:hypothetical protein